MSHKNTPISQGESYFENPYFEKVQFFRRTCTLFVGFKMKPLRKSIYQCQDKNKLKFCRKNLLKGATIHNYYLFDGSPFFKHLYSFICDNRCIELNWLCKHIEKVRSSQAANLVLNWVKKFFPVSIVKTLIGHFCHANPVL